MVRSLSSDRIYIRPGASDRAVLYATLWGAYDDLPSRIPRDRATRIWDLGANIGLIVALYATKLPLARITGVELDEDNAALARRNTAVFGDRCRILTGAAWTENGTVGYAIEPGGEQEARLATGQPGRRATAYALDTLLADDAWIDFLKMDIEGAEQQVLRNNTGWAGKVGCIKVECHAPYSVAEAARDLRALGFRVEESVVHPSALIGYRDPPDGLP